MSANTPDISDVRLLADYVRRGIAQDDRPQWLQNMPSASDNTALYYLFLYCFARRYAPLKFLEIGTYRGTSAAHMAYGAKLGGGGQVFTVDIDEAAKQYADEAAVAHDLSALTAIHSDSIGIRETLAAHAPFDVLFIDTAHNFNQAYNEYYALRPLVRDGGFIFFDDISLGHEMEALWDFIHDPKCRLDALHYTGFGVACKSPDINPPKREDIIAQALTIMASYRAKKATP